MDDRTCDSTAITQPRPAVRPTGRPGLSHRRPTALSTFYFGCCYYPEHWDVATRRGDAERMVAAGFNVVRLAEFAWDLMEPEPGCYDFDLFDEVVSELGANGIASILSTPTAAPPRWLTEAHPEILRVDAEGRPLCHGSRQHASHMHPVFREYARKITLAMAEHYRTNPHVVGWQTDNEFHCHFSEDHSDAAQDAFVTFLRRQYDDDIRRLNDAWGTAFWAQTYPRFESITTPRSGRPTYINPAHELAYYRFLSDAVAQFQHDQVQILREAQPNWFIFHNGLFEHIDYRGLLGQDLDFLGYDSYPFFDHDPVQRPMSHAFNLDRARAWSGNFIIPEHQAGPGGQAPYLHDTPEPGEMRRMSMAAIARGADSLLYFRWRTCRVGAEQYWCGLIDADDVPRRRYQEAKQLGEEMKRIGPAVLNTTVHVDVAVASADMDVSDAHSTYPLGLPQPDQVAEWVHGHFLRAGLAGGCVHPGDDLSGIRLYVIPHWALFDAAWLANLQQYVERGGTLIIGANTATRDMNNNLTSSPRPGCLRELAGVTVEEFGRQNAPAARPLTLQLDQGAEAQTELWYELLHCGPQTTPLASWVGRHLTGEAAVTQRIVGEGKVIYVGTYLTRPILDALLPGLVAASGAKPLWPDLPGEVDAVLREGPERRVWFFINRTNAPVRLPCTPVGQDLLNGIPAIGDEHVIEGHGVAVIEQACP